MPLYLSPYEGAGTRDDSFRPRGFYEPGASAIDIRLDSTRADGHGIPYALLWLPVGIPDPKGAEKIADDYGEPTSSLIKGLTNTKLGLDFSRDATIQEIVETILLRPDRDGWHAVRPCNGRLEAWLGSGAGKRQWFMNPVLAGGSISDNFNRANETPVAVPWTQQPGSAGTVNLASNAIFHTTVPGECFLYYAHGGGWNADQSSQFQYATAVDSDDWGPAVRIGSSGLSGYMFGQYVAQREVAKFVSGSYTSVENMTGSTSTGTTHKIDVVGTTIRCYTGGVENASSPSTDSSLTTAGNGAGVFFYGANGTVDDALLTGEISGKVSKNTRGMCLGMEVGMNWRGNI